MKCLTVGQPWADLIVENVRGMEKGYGATRDRGPY